ncbi:glycosyl transferase / Lysophospholipid acyltransferase [Catenovulum agarivorans DS-2]|uniref:Glycosyl transferase / Lysophospholipid acyltransferase n=1 Tax=Catenovulum agarivorans DS-2 TaxID=1328313 RepID=W7QFD3_9ALTE|nr:glycosyltransferase family 2 protein [Catenovulum agarivorans]EWH10616.1 glycosyl transferase / Lysophospholipid acyltransferase [Catenovulum agarivorans DS-2]
MSQFCFVIPNYNHHLVIEQTIADLQRFKLPVILVDDGSNQQTKQVLQQVNDRFDNVTLHIRAENGGKGAAVHDGLVLAAKLGYSHAVQVDADGQHNLADIDRLIALAKQHPTALISGQPIYDDSISKGRLYGRYFTHIWVHIETLSLKIKDSMCGFRVYPLAAYDKLTKRVSLGKRMDYDIEVMVRLYWQGCDVQFLPTKVIYPENGVSHFNVWKDNLLISKMHTKLFFGMLLRVPKLLWRKVKG